MNRHGKQYADGRVIVRDDRDGAVYLTREGAWSTNGAAAWIFTTSQAARDWIRRRSAGYWLGTSSGRARIISARAAGVPR